MLSEKADLKRLHMADYIFLYHPQNDKAIEMENSLVAAWWEGGGLQTQRVLGKKEFFYVVM